MLQVKTGIFSDLIFSQITDSDIIQLTYYTKASFLSIIHAQFRLTSTINENQYIQFRYITETNFH